MPRKSPEEKAAAYWRQGRNPRPAPKHLSTEAAKLWRDIVASRPPDLFSPGNYELLAQYCELSVLQEGYLAMLREDPQSPEYQATVCRVASTLCQLATKLRLALTSIDKRAGILTEREPVAEPQRGKRAVLFGSNVIKI
jgi:phage terminase small subunit